MRSTEEVQQEIDWRKNEIGRINELKKCEDWSEGNVEYLNWRIQSLSFSITWCEWFLNISKDKFRT